MGSWTSSYPTATPPHTFDNHMHRAAVPSLERGSNHGGLPRSRWPHDVALCPYPSIQGSMRLRRVPPADHDEPRRYVDPTQRRDSPRKCWTLPRGLTTGQRSQRRGLWAGGQATTVQRGRRGSCWSPVRAAIAMKRVVPRGPKGVGPVLVWGSGATHGRKMATTNHTTPHPHHMGGHKRADLTERGR